MRIYNAKKSQISIPLTATQKIVVPSHGTSVSFMPNPKILSLIVTSFDYSDIALIVSGPIEMTMCSETPCCSGFVVSSLEEAIERFSTPTTASMKCAAKVVDPNNDEQSDAEKKAEVNEEVSTTEETTVEEETAPVVDETATVEGEALVTTKSSKKRSKKSSK